MHLCRANCTFVCSTNFNTGNIIAQPYTVFFSRISSKEHLYFGGVKEGESK